MTFDHGFKTLATRSSLRCVALTVGALAISASVTRFDASQSAPDADVKSVAAGLHGLCGWM